MLASDEEDKRCAVKLLFLEEVKQSNRATVAGRTDRSAWRHSAESQRMKAVWSHARVRYFTVSRHSTPAAP